MMAFDSAVTTTRHSAVDALKDSIVGVLDYRCKRAKGTMH